MRDTHVTRVTGGVQTCEWVCAAHHRMPPLATACSTRLPPSPSNPYHHWRHAVDVAHLTFVLLSHAKSFHARHLSKVDLLCAMVAALGHDVGHR